MNNCPKCSFENPEGSKFCGSCNFPTENNYLSSPVCSRCGRSYPEGANYCESDGTRLTPSEQLVPKCVKCGTEYDKDVKFCPKDGGVVSQWSSNVDAGLNYGVDPITGNRLYPKASLGNRFLASFIDGLVFIALSIPAIVLFIVGIIKVDRYRTRGEGVVYLIIAMMFYIIPIVYSFIKDGLGKGQSWGKRASGIMVVHLPDNTPCTKGKSALRQLILVLFNFIPFVGAFVEPIIVLTAEDGRRLGDKVANTQVIDVTNYRK